LIEKKLKENEFWKKKCNFKNDAKQNK
jgi:hypothetical protein